MTTDKEKDTSGFLDWYKTNYGADYDGSSNLAKSETMSDKDYMLGRNMLENYRSQQSINTQQTNANQALIMERDNAQQQASISLDKLMKYVGQQQQVSGLNAGAGTSNAIAANNNYQNAMGDIKQNYQNSQNELENYYQGQRDTANNNAFTNESNLLNQYGEIERQQAAEAKAEQDGLQSTWATQIQGNLDNMASQLPTSADGKYSQESYNSLLNYLDENKNNLGDNYYNLLKDYVDKNYSTNIMSEEEQSRQNNIDNKFSAMSIPGVKKASGSAGIHADHADNCRLNYNGQDYYVEMDSKFSGSEEDLGKITSYMKNQYGRNDLQEGDTVMYDGELYVVTSNGELWTIKDRSHFWAHNWGTLNAGDLKKAIKANQ